MAEPENLHDPDLDHLLSAQVESTFDTDTDPSQLVGEPVPDDLGDEQ